MNKQRVVRVTITYNDMGIITDVKAEVEGADVRENVKGEWIDYGQYAEGHSHREIVCSICGYTYKGFLNEYKFCPNCGADMRGENEQQE